MDIMLRSGEEFNLKWTISISLIFHIIILFFLLSNNLFTKNGSFDSMYKPFTAVQVNLVDMSSAGLTNTNHENILVNSKQSPVTSKKAEGRRQKAEVRNEKQELRNQMQEVRSKKLETGNQYEGVVVKAPQISKEISDSQEAKLTTPWSDSATGSKTSDIAGPAGPAVDAPDFKYDYYLGLIRNKVDNRWNQPVAYSHVKKAVVEFTILRNGRIDNVRISESSGDTYFDQTAVRAVSVSTPFPPLPKGYKENSLRVRYKFIFEKAGKG